MFKSKKMDVLQEKLKELIIVADIQGRDVEKAILMITLGSIISGKEEEMLIAITPFCEKALSSMKNIAAQKN